MDMDILKEYDVVVVGGGITGAGTARDCAMRGLKVLLVEKYDLTNGATGRNHGLLHSGARYAVTDPESASECIKENMILRKIARHCVDETDGLFITLPEDDLAYQATFVASCRKAGIRADIISPEEARRLEPAVNPSLIGAVRVPDASVDPFRLTTANVIDARRHGADMLTYHEAVGFVVESGCVRGVRLRDNHTGDTFEVRSRMVVNAAGIWGHLVARLAGVTVNMFPAKHAARLRPQGQRHGRQPLPPARQRRHSRAGRHRLRHRNDQRPRVFRHHRPFESNPRGSGRAAP